jgi:hypothetical protein
VCADGTTFDERIKKTVEECDMEYKRQDRVQNGTEEFGGWTLEDLKFLRESKIDPW